MEIKVIYCTLFCCIIGGGPVAEYISVGARLLDDGLKGTNSGASAERVEFITNWVLLTGSKDFDQLVKEENS